MRRRPYCSTSQPPHRSIPLARRAARLLFHAQRLPPHFLYHLRCPGLTAAPRSLYSAKKMADLAVTSQLQQWSFEKPAARPERSSSDSTASSPILCDDTPEALRIDTTSSERRNPSPRRESVALQERYMSSEEDLSPADDGSDSEYDYDDVVVHDPAKECKARTMSISRWSKGKSCDMAVTVSYAFVGRPKVVELQDCKSPTVEAAPVYQKRSASLANLPFTPLSQLRIADAAQRLSMKVQPTSNLASLPTSRSTSPLAEVETRRPSTSHSPTTKAPSSLHLTDSTSTTSSFRTATSTQSVSPAVDDILSRPLTAVVDVPSSARSSVYISSQSRGGLARTQTTQSAFRQSQWAAPPTPASPATHAFLSSDPYENNSIHSASPIIKPAPHKRLRSISMKLALAKIAITPSKKTYDTRVDGKVPNTPATPLTPQTAPIQGSGSFASPNRLRRASTILRPRSRHGETSRGPSPETAPPVPSINLTSVASNRLSKMQARGANEREPTLVIPPCPSDTDEDPMASFKSRKIKKRKSLMSLMDAL